MLDSAAYNSIYNSVFFRNEFANIQKKTLQPGNNDSWTATYIFGQNTYLELFNNGRDENDGLSGIAFCVETSGGVDSLYNKLKKKGISSFEKGLRTQKTETGESPWFYFLASAQRDSNSLLSTWLMEYDFKFMKKKFPDLKPETINITRKLYNSDVYRKDLLLKDIIEIELALNQHDRDKFYNELKIYGYQIEQQGELLTAKGPAINIIMHPKSAANEAGICRIKFSLTDKSYKPKTMIVSPKLKLTLNNDKTADWYFKI